MRLIDHGRVMIAPGGGRKKYERAGSLGERNEDTEYAIGKKGRLVSHE